MSATCKEAALGLSFYMPCGKPAIKIVGWKGRTETPIPMCAMCADHNVKNRSGFVVAEVVRDEDES